MFLVPAGCGSSGGDDGGGGTGRLCSLDLTGAVDSNFGDARLDALLEAAGRFSAAAADIDTEMNTACNNIASDLGQSSSDDTEIACDNAVAGIEAALDANAGVVLTVDVVPPTCSVASDVFIDCVAECDASFDAEATPPTCEGGELSGSCSGSCSGECTVSGDVDCAGSCSGSCSGSCDATVVATCEGTCNGRCDGTCSATGPDGECMGTCEGTCRGSCEGTITGSCSGTCEGSCEGECRAEIDGECSGQCSGECSVAFEEPRCEGGTLDVEADADCQAACEADASFDLECDEPEVVVTFTGEVTAQAELDALIATLEANYGAIVIVARRAEIITSATLDLAGAVTGAVAAATTISLEAADCVQFAIETVASASASVSVSVEASASVSGSASGG